MAWRGNNRVAFLSGPQEGHHLINEIELVGGSTSKGKRKLGNADILGPQGGGGERGAPEENPKDSNSGEAGPALFGTARRNRVR